jgi:hypothetical protein
MFIRAVVALVLASLSCVGRTAEPSTTQYKHLGVATCGSGICHGKDKPQPERDVVLLNESRTWQYCDDHSKAFKALSSTQSQAIAAKLGIPSAAAANLCLDCHADNIPKTMQGPKFQLSDGIGCEACHGGAEKWIETHKQKTVSHGDNVAAGMYPSEQPLRRAELCLSCHMGTRDKFATHMIMGAGHPRLVFELQAYAFNQPAHVQVESASGNGECVRRKDRVADLRYHVEDMNLWVAGQIENARRYLELLQSRMPVSGSFLPDLALYDCFSCHHPIDKDKQRWSRARAGAGIQPGTLRLQKHHLVMLQAITEALAPDSLNELVSATDGLVRAGQIDVASTQAAAQKLHAWIDAHQEWASRKYSKEEIAKVRRTVIRYAAEDKASDYMAAEQVVIGIDSLSDAYGDHAGRKSALDALYNVVNKPSAFDPGQFKAAAGKVLSQF